MAKANPASDLLSELVDHFGALRLKVDEFRPTLNEHDRTWEKLKAQIADYPNEKPIKLKGRHYEIDLDARANERKVIVKPPVFERLKKLFGAKRFWELVKFPVTPIDAMFQRDDEQVKNFIAETQTGPRKILAVRLLDDPAAAKAA